MVIIERISGDRAAILCREITADLPDYFGLPAANEYYAEGVQTRTNFAVKIEGAYIGLLSLDFPYPPNSNIYWMGILHHFQGKGVGRQLLNAACTYAYSQGDKTMTVETVAPLEADENYLKTYRFYEKNGFSPLFNLKPNGYEWNMVYMVKAIDHLPSYADDTLQIRAFQEADILFIPAAFAQHNWLKPTSLFQEYWDEQEANERMMWMAFKDDQFAGYITLKWRSQYASFQLQGIPEIKDLNVLPPFRKQNIGTRLLKTAESHAHTKSKQVGIGVGLHSSYGAAQKMYIKQGYIPDGEGPTYNYHSLEYGASSPLDDDFILWMIKELKQ